MTDEKIARINALYHKQKTTGLTKEEEQEQARLRKEYIMAIRADLSNTLQHVRIQRPDGTIEELKKKNVQ